MGDTDVVRLRLLELVQGRVEPVPEASSNWSSEDVKAIVIVGAAWIWTKEGSTSFSSLQTRLTKAFIHEQPILYVDVNVPSCQEEMNHRDDLEAMGWKIVSVDDALTATNFLRAYGIASLPGVLTFDESMKTYQRTKIQHFLSDEERVISWDLAKCIRAEATQKYENGQVLQALQLYMNVFKSYPMCATTNFNIGVMLHSIGLSFLVVDHLLRVVEVSPNDSTANTVLRTVLFPLERTAVVNGYRRVVQLHPENVRAAHSLDTLEGSGKISNPEYVRQVFDDLADTFEDKLVRHLQYKVPWLLVEALEEVGIKGKTNLSVLDVGCGTGLCGRLIRKYASRLIGNDLSPLMIQKSHESGVYDDLKVANINDTLNSFSDMELGVVLSADVWIYVGDLDEIFRLASSKLQPGGFFAFSIESLPLPNDAFDDTSRLYRLGPKGRFQHSQAYISQLGIQCGFNFVIDKSIVVRLESNEAIEGRVYVLQRPDE